MKRCLDLANEFLEDAKLCLANLRLRAAINNAYYAMFHASQAILVAKGVSPPKTHKGLREKFGKEIIKAGLMESQYGKDLSRAFEMRQASTYDVFTTYSKEDVNGIVDRAERFVRKNKRTIRNGHINLGE
ncbi:MAG: HEPN domain-containing protein [Candidatus Bathyarchaeia archaeon]